MAKNVSFSKLGLTKNTSVEELVIGEEVVEIKQYLPIGQKLALVAGAVKGSVVEGTVSEMVLDTSLHFGIIENYTNINITAKMKEDILDTFDIFESSGLLEQVIARIPEEEYGAIFRGARAEADNLNKLLESAIQGFVAEDAAQTKMREALQDAIESDTVKEAIKQGRK